MVDKKLIQKWLIDGTITKTQAKKMLVDSNKEYSEEKSNKFISIISIIGVVLIFIGFAWLIAKTWRQIPNPIKVLILVGSTLGAFVSGGILRQKNHEGVGRSLITLGALLFILSLFLISQIYHLATSKQHYAWLLFLALVVIIITAYLLDSPENLVVSMIIFFPWVILQYYSSISRFGYSLGGAIIFDLILIFLSSGVLLFGLNILHNSLEHKFANIYRFWTVFYFLAIFYLLSFQSFLPLISQYSFKIKAFSTFLVIFIIICFFVFIIGSLFAIRKSSIFLKEIFGFIIILAVLFILILSTKAGAGLMGTCYPKECYGLNLTECISLQDYLNCEWKTDAFDPYGRCEYASCYNYKTEKECNSVTNKLKCKWQNGQCNEELNINKREDIYKTCIKNTNQKDNCVKNSLCKWQPYSFWGWNVSRGLPTILWLLWIINNFVFIGFIILILWYGQQVGSTKIINLALFTFVLEIITRYIGFWRDFRGYFTFSVLAILGGIMLIVGALLIPKWRKKILEKTKHQESLIR